MSIKSNIEYIQELKAKAAEQSGRRAEDVLLVAVTKLHTPEEMNEAIDAGITDIGENKVQEILDKYDKVKPVRWHLIGHLQTNKVKYIIPYIYIIESVDSLKLLREIEKCAAIYDRKVNVLLEIHVARESTKTGLSISQCRELLADGEWKEMPHVCICGIMTMATNTEDIDILKEDFRTAYDFYKEVKQEFFYDNDDFSIRSWGMTHDYLVACDNGSNQVRIGTAIFGDR